MGLVRVFWLMLGLFVQVAMAAETLPEHQSYTLDNGLQVVVIREGRAPLVVTQVWYRVGSYDEQEGITGISHMLEHMMFQGTERVAPGQYSKQIARLGGHDNAATSQDYTFYYSTLAKEHLATALQLEADRMRNLVLTEAEFQQENKVVQEERRMRVENSPQARIQEQYGKILYGQHPYSHPVIGWMSDVQGLNVAKLKGWYQRYYAPNNATLVVAGDVDFEHTRQLVLRYFGPLQADASVQPPVVAPWQPHTQRQVLNYSDAQVRRATWMASWLVPHNGGGADQRESYALKLAVQLLDGGISNRLQRLTQSAGGLVNAGASYSMFGRGPASFSLYAMPQKGVSMKQVEAMMMTEITRLATQPASPDELRKVKNGLLASQIYARDSVQGIANVVGRLNALGLEWQSYYRDFEARVEQVTPEEIQQVVQRYLQPQQALIGTLTPALEETAQENQG
ncbi:peptidase M16 domain protein [Magnetococcus marinus MC-1]|uniref:Peptidase M16 domain protein n=1 Tax=Magnetococcus marinus (strain ATCC BAA-1437 / JCM 17883 / MC-1) TaxID=156889 RepID=A0L9K2_MAGMM|nr:pitrilysin family protein [Magnetococcus marinus]ABK44645.1 peptidase M16 domain protein [Magnetococcus marinus MC-1]